MGGQSSSHHQALRSSRPHHSVSRRETRSARALYGLDLPENLVERVSISLAGSKLADQAGNAAELHGRLVKSRLTTLPTDKNATAWRLLDAAIMRGNRPDRAGGHEISDRKALIISMPRLVVYPQLKPNLRTGES